MTQRTTAAAIHTGYWGLHLTGLTLFLAIVRAPHARAGALPAFWAAWPVVILAMAPSAAAFYASYGPLFSSIDARRGLFLALRGAATICAGAAALGLTLAAALFGARQPLFSHIGEFAATTALFAALAAGEVAAALLVRGFLAWWRTARLRFESAPLAVATAVTTEAAAPPTRRDVIFVKTEQRLERVRLDEVLLIEGQRDYRRIHTESRRIMTLQTFAEFERQLPPDRICRVHKSYMVAIDKIEAIERGRIRIGPSTIPISDTYRDRFLALIGHN